MAKKIGFKHLINYVGGNQAYEAEFPLPDDGGRCSERKLRIVIRTCSANTFEVLMELLVDKERIQIGGFKTSDVDKIADLLYGVARIKKVRTLEPI